MNDTINIKKMYSLLETLSDETEKKIIISLINKRKNTINLKILESDFTDKNLYRYYDGVRKIYIEAWNYCVDVFDICPETGMSDFYEEYNEKIKKILYKYQVINCKISKIEDSSLKAITRETSNIELFNNIIKIIKEYETSK